MTRLPELRMIIDPQPNTGAWNMAVDEVLLESAIERQVATFRLYRWCEPTVSLGYFQSEDEVKRDQNLAALPCVRRLSGGGALVHDQELTYSLALPAGQRIVDRPVALYELVHQAFIDVLGNRGVSLRLRGSTIKRKDEPLLCFARADEHDLVVGEHKILGSAQRRRRGAILQHGGLLLRTSSTTPELPGVCDLAKDADFVGFEMSIGSYIAAEIADQVSMASLTDLEHAFVCQMVRMLR